MSNSVVKLHRNSLTFTGPPIMNGSDLVLILFTHPFFSDDSATTSEGPNISTNSIHLLTPITVDKSDVDTTILSVYSSKTRFGPTPLATIWYVPNSHGLIFQVILAEPVSLV